MELNEKQIKKEILYNEEKLLRNEIRNDAKMITELTENNCIEISETGVQSIYQFGQTLKEIDGVLYITSDEPQLINLSEDCKLLIYIAVKVKKNTRSMINCSSIWKMKNEKWKAVFQQRTTR